MSLFLPNIDKLVFREFPTFTHPFLKDVFKDKKFLSRKKANFLLNRMEMKTGRSKIVSYPYYLVIDPSNICNLKCPLCPTWQDLKARPKGMMNMETFRKLFEEVGPYVFAINLCNWGEPLLNPDICRIIKFAKSFNTVVGLSTNLNSLTDDKAQEIVASGIDILVVSLDGDSQESYAKYRVGGDFGKVMDNLKKLLSLRKDGKHPLLVWQFLVNRHNESEIEKAKERAGQLGMLFMPSPMRTSMGKELLQPLYERVKDVEEWLPLNPRYNRYNYTIRPETRTRQITCNWLWKAMVINWDGSVSPCCGVFEKKWDFDACYSAEGKNLTIREVWNSPRYRLARKLVSAHMKKSKNLPPLLKLAKEDGLICAQCIKYGFLEE
jgi:MoaA/NifB/PqqE/SkfB family radical SAM enzyme